MLYKYIVIILLLSALILGCAGRNPEESAKHLRSGIELQNKGKLDEAKRNGIKLINETARIGADNMLVAFLHPKSTNSVLIEFTEEQK